MSGRVSRRGGALFVIAPSPPAAGDDHTRVDLVAPSCSDKRPYRWRDTTAAATDDKLLVGYRPGALAIGSHAMNQPSFAQQHSVHGVRREVIDDAGGGPIIDAYRELQ